MSIGGCSSPLLVPCLIHVDADGGCGPVCRTGQSVCQVSRQIHCRFHYRQLW